MYEYVCTLYNFFCRMYKQILTIYKHIRAIVKCVETMLKRIRIRLYIVRILYWFNVQTAMGNMYKLVCQLKTKNTFVIWTNIFVNITLFFWVYSTLWCIYPQCCHWILKHGNSPNIEIYNFLKLICRLIKLRRIHLYHWYFAWRCSFKKNQDGLL